MKAGYAIYRAQGSGTLFMLKDGDPRLAGSLYALVTRGKRTAVPVQQPGMKYAGHLLLGDDGKPYVVYADWSAGLLTAHRPETLRA